MSPVLQCGVSLHLYATGSRSVPLADPMSILKRMQFLFPISEPATISFQIDRFSSTERVRHLDSIFSRRSFCICSIGVSSAYARPDFNKASPSSRSCGK